MSHAAATDTAVALPREALGVWSTDDAEGRRRCETYRSLPATLPDDAHDAASAALVGSLVITPTLVHAYSEYGEGDFHAPHRVRRLGPDRWKVESVVGVDAMPSAAADSAEGDRPFRTTHVLRLAGSRLSWRESTSSDHRPSDPAPTAADAYFRCGDVRNDLYRTE